MSTFFCYFFFHNFYLLEYSLHPLALMVKKIPAVIILKYTRSSISHEKNGLRITPPSLRTADAFPVVAPPPPKNRWERPHDRKRVCCSQEMSLPN